MFKKSLAVGVAAALLTVSSIGAFAAEKDTEWQKKHPRREQVNERLANQNKRIRNEVREGEMSPAEAAALHKQDRQIRQEERTMASHDGGHITKADQKSLNQQENAVSKEIGK